MTLRDFLKTKFPWLTPTRYTDALCNHLQAVAAGEIKRLVVSMPPATGKTIITSVAFPAWMSTKRPDYHVLLGSFTFAIANKYAGPGVDPVAVGDALPGTPFDCAIIDGGSNFGTTRSERARAYDWLTKRVLPALKPDGACIVIDSRLHTDDLAGRCADWTQLTLASDPNPEVEKLIGSVAFAAQFLQQPVLDSSPQDR